jgi:hypothetical protein
MNAIEQQIIVTYLDKSLTLMRDIALASLETEKAIATGTISAEYVQLRTAQVQASGQALGVLVTEARTFGEAALAQQEEVSKRGHELRLLEAKQAHELSMRRLDIEEKRHEAERLRTEARMRQGGLGGGLGGDAYVHNNGA